MYKGFTLKNDGKRWHVLGENCYCFTIVKSLRAARAYVNTLLLTTT